MKAKTISNGILRAIFTLIIIAIILYLLYQIQSVIVYIIIAAVISLTGAPLVQFLRHRFKFNDSVSVIITMLLIVGSFVGLILLFIPLVIEQGHNLSLLNIEKLQGNFNNVYLEVSNYLESKHIVLEKSLEDYHLLSKINYSAIPDFLNSILSGFGTFSVAFFSVLFISFFFLKDRKLLENSFMVVVPENKKHRVKKSLYTIKHLLSRYFLGLLIQIFILFVIYAVVLSVFGIDNAIVISFLCALLNLIPYIGPLISAILMIALTLSSNIENEFSVALSTTVYVLIGFVFAQFIDNFFSQPIIFSRSVKSHPLEIFLVIIIAGILFGIIGMVVAVPTYTAIKVILKEFLSENKIVKLLTKDL
ncbi:permease [Formosa agariphila KMM 3901]|uniref:Permease n=1 Tax=Formosa agariphila (strain DSM 15362 / KCTC 12365 / LMG 23005 / KMM 3901 / M-2Alg 35-1) TaxID=1347342 RepID=T2KKR8_FORAG|nr:AI-2E family transporter [Formosa agariphila]CDF79038.1 permease [Formosa agariphila KMM 3901]